MFFAEQKNFEVYRKLCSKYQIIYQGLKSLRIIYI